MKRIPAEYYGDSWRWFIGTVVDGNPPDGMEGRVRVRIHGLHSSNITDIPQRDLPWAQCLVPSTEGGSGGIGASPGIRANSLVFGFFADGENSQVPIVAGSLPRREFRTRANEAPLPLPEFLEPDAGPDADLRAREDYAVEYFVARGMPFRGAVALTASLSVASGMVRPLGSWEGGRLDDFLARSGDGFAGELEFVVGELHSGQADLLVALSSPTATQDELIAAAGRYQDGEPPDPFAVADKFRELFERFLS